MTTKTQIESSVKKLLEESKGKKKFKQSIDFIVNFKDVDFKKPENRPVIDVTLPTQARVNKICVFADSAVALEAKNEEIVDRMLRRFKSRRQSLLLKASQLGNLYLVKKIIELGGVDIKAVLKDIMVRDPQVVRYLKHMS